MYIPQDSNAKITYLPSSVAMENYLVAENRGGGGTRYHTVSNPIAWKMGVTNCWITNHWDCILKDVFTHCGMQFPGLLIPRTSVFKIAHHL